MENEREGNSSGHCHFQLFWNFSGQDAERLVRGKNSDEDLLASV